jgi:hypothetical protein
MISSKALVVSISAIVAGCGMNSNDGEYYLPVWKDCKDAYGDFYEKNSEEMTFYPFPEPLAFHPDLLGVAKISTIRMTEARYPAIPCVPNAYTVGGSGETLNVEEFVEGLKFALMVSRGTGLEVQIRDGSYKIFYYKSMN